MSFDVDLSGKAILVAVVLLLTAFSFFFAPSLIVVGAILVVLAILAYFVWLIGVGINDRLRRRAGGGRIR